MSKGSGSGVGLPTAGVLMPGTTVVGGHLAPPLSTVQVMLTTASDTPGAFGVSTKCGTSRVAVADVLVNVTSYLTSPDGGMLVAVTGGRKTFCRLNTPGTQGGMPRY